MLLLVLGLGKREITDRDLEAIVSEQVQLPEAKFQLRLVQVSCGNASKPTATITFNTKIILRILQYQ